MAAGDLPVHVVSGEPIVDTWGNSVVDNIDWLRNHGWDEFSHGGVNTPNGGMYDLGTTYCGPWSYPVKMTVMAIWWFGFATGRTNGDPSIQLLQTGEIRGSGACHCAGSVWASAVIDWSWSVPVGSVGSFKTRFNVSYIEYGGIYAGANGLWKAERRGTP